MHLSTPRVVSDPSSLRFDRNLTAASLLWRSGLLLGLVGNFMRWEWLATTGPQTFPDQVWGDRVPSSVENTVVLITLVLSIAMTTLWWLTGPRVIVKFTARTQRLLQFAGTSIKWLQIFVSTCALIGILVLLGAYASDWWLPFPGWVAQFFAQLLVLAGALLHPPVAGPHRSTIRERHRKVVYICMGSAVAAALAPFGVGAIFDSTINRFVEGPSFESALLSASPAELEITPAISPRPWGAAGLQAEVSGLDAPASIAWTRQWRGAKDATLVVTAGGGTQGVQLTQATLGRPALVIVDEATGAVRASLSTSAIQQRHLEIQEDPSFARFLFTYGDQILRSGPAHEWVTLQGERLQGPPRTSYEAATSQMLSANGVHSTDLVTGESWFVGDGYACKRRIASVEGSPMVNQEGTVIMTQICDIEAQASPEWNHPEELSATGEPLSGTVFAIDLASGDLKWSSPLPGWDQWVSNEELLHPTSKVFTMPLKFEVIDGQPQVSMDGVVSVFDFETGF